MSSYLDEAPFRFDPRLNDVLCSRPLPACHQTFMTTSSLPVEISFPTAEQAAATNPFAVVPLGGVLTFDEVKLKAMIERFRPAPVPRKLEAKETKNEPMRPPISELMQAVKGYRVVETNYVETILQGQVHPASLNKVGHLFGITCNPFFPLKNGVKGILDSRDAVLKNKHSTRTEMQQDAYVYGVCLQAWSMTHGRWLVALRYDESQPQWILVLDPLDLQRDQDAIDETKIPAAQWLAQPWSFMTYYCKVAQALGMKLHKVCRVDRVHTASFVSLTIHDYDGLMARIYPEVLRSGYQDESAWQTGLRLFYWKRRDNMDLHMPQFLQHAWFNFLRPLLRIEAEDQMEIDQANAMYEIVADSFLADVNTSNQKYKTNGCPLSLLKQHRLPHPYTMFRLPEQYNGRLFWTLNKRACHELQASETPRAAFWHPSRLDVPLYFETVRQPPRLIVLEDSPDEEKRKTRGEYPLVEMSPTLLEDVAKLQDLPLGPYPLATAYFHLIRSGVPVSRAYRAVFHLRYVTMVEDCKHGRHPDCHFPAISATCPLSLSWLSNPEDASLEYLVGDTPRPLTTEAFLSQGAALQAYALPHREIHQRLLATARFTRAIDYLKEFQEFFDTLGLQIDQLCELSLNHMKGLSYIAKAQSFTELMPRSHLLATWRSYGDSFAHHCNFLTERLRQPLIMQHLARKHGLEFFSRESLSDETILTMACDLLHRSQLADPSFAVGIRVPVETLDKYPFWTRGDVGGCYYESDALYFLHELFRFAVLQPFVLVYAAYWAPAPGPSLTGQPGVFWPELRLALPMDLDLDQLDQEADEDARMLQALDEASTDPTRNFFTRRKQAATATPIPLSVSIQSKRGGKGSRGRRGGRGGVVAGRKESRLSLMSVTDKMNGLVHRLTKKTSQHTDVNMLAHLQAEAASGWTLKTKHMTSLMQECAAMDEKTDIGRILTTCLLMLSLKRRCRSRQDADVYPQLVGIQFFIHKFERLLKPLWDGRAFLADIPDEPINPTLLPSSSAEPTPLLRAQPEIWTTETSTPIVKYLYDKLTACTDKTLTVEDIDILIARLATQQCRFDRARDHLMQALIILSDFANDGTHNVQYPFLGEEKRGICGINLTMFLYHYTHFYLLHMPEEDTTQYVVTPPTDPREGLAHKLAVAVLQHLRPFTPVLANSSAASSSSGVLPRSAMEELPLLFVSQPPPAPAEHLRSQLPLPIQFMPMSDDQILLKPLPLAHSPQSSLDLTELHIAE